MKFLLLCLWGQGQSTVLWSLLLSEGRHGRVGLSGAVEWVGAQTLKTPFLFSLVYVLRASLWPKFHLEI